MNDITINTQEDSYGNQSSAYTLFLDVLEEKGIAPNEMFTSKEEFINNLYGTRWRLSNSSTRTNTVSLVTLYELDLGFYYTSLMLKVFKFWAMTRSPSTVGSRIGVICKIIRERGIGMLNDVDFLKMAYSDLTTANKKNLNYLFRALYDTFRNIEFKEQRSWSKNNLDTERVNPHDPVNGAYSDYQFNEFVDRANADIGEYRCIWSEKMTKKSFSQYSTSIFHLFSLITSRRPAQFVQCKVIDISPCHSDKLNIKIDENLVEIRFYKAKATKSGFRANPEKSYFPLSQHFSKIILRYLLDLKSMIKKLCNDFRGEFKDIEWNSFPLFPSMSLIKSLDDLMSPSMHTDKLHRVFRSNCSAIYNISRVRHTTITRGLEMGLTNIELARLTGLTTAATRNYKDLTPKSRNLINERFCKNDLLINSFTWTLREYNEHFERVCSDEFGQELGGIQKVTSCRSCSKKLGAPLGCYTCGSGSFIPFLEGNHHSQLIKAQAKKRFLEVVGANRHQLFEIDFIVKRIEQVILKQKQYGYKVLE